MRILSVVSGKGGVGKTTIASALGASLCSDYGKRVFLMDCNLFTSHLSLHLGIENPQVSLNHILSGSADLKDAIYNHKSGVKIIPTSLSTNDSNGIDISLLPSVVEQINSNYFGKMDFLILDSAPGLGREALAALRSSKEALFITTPQIPSVIDVVRCRHMAEDMGIKTTGGVLNMVSGERTELKGDEVERIIGMPLLASVSYDRNVTKALASSSPFNLFKSRSKGSKEVKRLASEVLRITG